MIAAIAQEDAGALRLLYDRHVGRVYSVALNHLRSEVDAEEVTQDVFAKVWRAAASFRYNSQVTTWIYRITVNTSLSALKKRRGRGLFSVFGSINEPSDHQHPENALEEQEANQTLFTSIYRLPTRQKTVFVLSYVEDLPRQEVADITQLSLKAVEGLLMRAKKNLRTYLQADYPERYSPN